MLNSKSQLIKVALKNGIIDSAKLTNHQDFNYLSNSK